LGWGDTCDDAFVYHGSSQQIMAPMRDGYPFILWLARRHRNYLLFLAFCKGRWCPGTIGILQHLFDPSAIFARAQSSCLVFRFQLFKLILVDLPALTPATDGIPSNSVFARNTCLIS